MDIVIKKLTPDLAEDYIRFFDVTPHDVKIDEQKCYCVTWRGDGSYKNGEPHWFATLEERREKAIEFIKNGYIRGYLAYLNFNGKVIGWCNANEECLLGVDYLRSFWPIEKYRADIKIKPVFCFMIAPEMQRKGVATALLNRVCEDAAKEGFDYAEAYVCEKSGDITCDFRGAAAMYEKCGFYIYAKREDKIVMRKALKKEK